MNPLDDFFAFNDDPVEVKPEKKKKKKKKSKTVSPAVKSNDKFDNDDSLVIQGNPKALSTDNSAILNSETTESNKPSSAEEMLAGLLGLSEPLKPNPADRENRVKRTKYLHHISLSDQEDGSPMMEEFEKAEDDGFLAEMNSYLSSATKQDQLAAELLNSKQSETIFIDGMELEGKAVKFEFHVIIEAASQISGAYDLQVKGSTKVSKLIQTLMDLFNQTADPQYPPSQYGNLVFYVQSLNVILKPGLRILSLLAYKNLLEKSVTVTGYEVDAMITTEEYATVLYNNNKNIRTTQIEHETKIEDEAITIYLEDMQSEDEPKDIHNLEVLTDMKLSEVIEVYKFRAKLPTRLTVKILKEDQTLCDCSSTLKSLEILRNQKLFVRYDREELTTLRGVDGGAFEVEYLEDADDFEDLDVSPTNKENGESTEDYFTVYMVGKDKKRYKVNVKPSTKIASLAQFYKEKSELSSDVDLRLCFDDEDLDMNGVIADTELEEDYMIDVVY